MPHRIDRYWRAANYLSVGQTYRLFTFSVARHVAALACTLGGLDGLVFAGGVGENAAPIPAAVCERLRWMGVEFDADAAGRLHTGIGASRIALRAVATDEEAVIAHGTRQVLGFGKAGCGSWSE